MDIACSSEIKYMTPSCSAGLLGVLGIVALCIEHRSLFIEHRCLYILEYVPTVSNHKIWYVNIKIASRGISFNGQVKICQLQKCREQNTLNNFIYSRKFLFCYDSYLLPFLHLHSLLN